MLAGEVGRTPFLFGKLSVFVRLLGVLGKALMRDRAREVEGELNHELWNFTKNLVFVLGRRTKHVKITSRLCSTNLDKCYVELGMFCEYHSFPSAVLLPRRYTNLSKSPTIEYPRLA